MRLTIYLLSLVFFTSCSQKLTYFTQDLYDKYRWSDEELKNIQFYLSEDIVLHKKADASSAQIEDGKIKLTKENSGEKVVIKKGTPGVFLFSPKSYRFAISFHEKDDSKYLMFGPNNKNDGKFGLLAKDWEKFDGTVTYNNEKYTVKNQSAFSTLLVDLRKFIKDERASKIEKGRKI